MSFENPLPSGEALRHTALELLRTAGRIVTLRAFLPEEPFASHGDHFIHPLDEPIEPVVASDWPEKKPVPDIAGRDISRGWTDQGEYLER